MARTNKDPIRKVVRSDGVVRWKCVVDAGHDVDGRRRQIKRTFDSLREARAFVASTRVAVHSGTYVGRVETTLSEYAVVWLVDAA